MVNAPLQIPVQQFKSKTAGNRPASLLDGQLGVQQADGLLFWSDANGNVQSFSLRGATGTTILDFTAAGGLSASTVLTGLAGVLATSAVDAWLVATATADHSADEHVAESVNLSILAGNIVAGTGFTISAIALGAPLYGKWTVSWSWN